MVLAENIKYKIQLTIGKTLFLNLDLRPTSIEPIFKNFIGNHFKDDAFVHPHTDPAPNGFVHTRCNLMLKKPLKGGNPILDGEEIYSTIVTYPKTTQISHGVYDNVVDMMNMTTMIKTNIKERNVTNVKGGKNRLNGLFLMIHQSLEDF
jgi:hypothetical protein